MALSEAARPLSTHSGRSMNPRPNRQVMPVPSRLPCRERSTRVLPTSLCRTHAL
jgi:hypothetical protein